VSTLLVQKSFYVDKTNQEDILTSLRIMKVTVQSGSWS